MARLLKKHSCVFAILCWTTLLLMLPAGLKAETWKIASAEFPPYSGPDLPGQGIAISALRKVLESKGIKVEVEFYPWGRSKRIAARSDFVGFFPAWPEEVRENFMPSKGIVESKVGLLYMKERPPKWKNMEELFRDYQICLIQNYRFSDEVEAAAQRYPHNVVSAPHEENLVKMMSLGRVKAAITDIRVMLHYADLLGIDNMEFSPRSVEYKRLVLAFSDRQDNYARLELLDSLLD